jgi:serine/threonine protein phosphatase PrpC
VVAFLLDATGRGVVAHVGDSRAYRHRGGRLEALTTDHSVVAEMLKRGVLTAEEAAYHPRRNEILRSVGVLEEVEVEIAAVDIAAGDRILLCSDGLCGVLSDAEIDEILACTASPEDAVDALVELANDCGGPDNITVELLTISPEWKSGARKHTAVGPGVGASIDARPRSNEAGMSAAPSAAGVPPGIVAESPREADSRRVALGLAFLTLLIAGAYWLYRSA